MPYYEYRGAATFRDSQNDREIEPGDVVELDPHLVGNHAFVEVEEPDTEGSNPGGSDSEDGEEIPIEEKEYSELRDMAVEADTDEINGRSGKDEIIAYFTE